MPFLAGVVALRAACSEASSEGTRSFEVLPVIWGEGSRPSPEPAEPWMLCHLLQTVAALLQSPRPLYLPSKSNLLAHGACWNWQLHCHSRRLGRIWHLRVLANRSAQDMPIWLHPPRTDTIAGTMQVFRLHILGRLVLRGCFGPAHCRIS